ncbi:hypothetical protein ACA910_019040 [Epithemia clementina (nom. ined.)]
MDERQDRQNLQEEAPAQLSLHDMDQHTMKSVHVEKDNDNANRDDNRKKSASQIMGEWASWTVGTATSSIPFVWEGMGNVTSHVFHFLLPNWSSYSQQQQHQQQQQHYHLPSSLRQFWETHVTNSTIAGAAATGHKNPFHEALLHHFDTNHDGTIGADEVLNMTEFFQKLFASSSLWAPTTASPSWSSVTSRTTSWLAQFFAREWPLLDWKLGVFLWRTFGGILFLCAIFSIVPGSLHGWSARLLRWPILGLTYCLIYVELVVYIVIRLFIRIAEWMVAMPKHRKLRQLMASAQSYEEWYQHASALDKSQKRDKWLRTFDHDTSHIYNWNFIKELIKDMQMAQAQGDSIFALAVIQQCTRPNVGGIMSSDLFSYANTGEPKQVVKEFMQHVVQTLHWITQEAMDVPLTSSWDAKQKQEYQINVQNKVREEKGKLWQTLAGWIEKTSNGLISLDNSDNEDDSHHESSGHGAEVGPGPATMWETPGVVRNTILDDDDHDDDFLMLPPIVLPDHHKDAAAHNRLAETLVTPPPPSMSRAGKEAGNNHSSNGMLPPTKQPLPAVHRDQVLEFLKRARSAYGRSALCLSGGAMMGLYHFGVLKGLARQGILPRIISGTSAGSVVGSVICTRTDEELKTVLHPDVIAPHMTCFDRPWKDRLISIYKNGHMFDLNEWMVKIKWFTNGDTTFEEAFRRTGRIFCITLSSTSKKASPILINYLSAPNVTIASAVLASAAVPGFIPPVRLQYKDSSGVIRGYGDHDQTYYDGSIRQDIPTSGLAEMLNCQFFIASQCNPHIVPFFFNPKGGVGRPSRWSSGDQEHSWRGGFLLAALEMYLKNDMKAKCVFLHDLEAAVGFTSTMMTQEFVGSTTIVPQVAFQDYFKLFTDPNPRDLARYFQCGEVAAYEHTELIKLHYSIANALDDCIAKLEGRSGDDRSANSQRASFI